MVAVVENYKEFLSELDTRIGESGYKVGHLASILGLQRTTFWKKRKSGKWTIEEAEKLAEILHLE